MLGWCLNEKDFEGCCERCPRMRLTCCSLLRELGFNQVFPRAIPCSNAAESDEGKYPWVLIEAIKNSGPSPSVYSCAIMMSFAAMAVMARVLYIWKEETNFKSGGNENVCNWPIHLQTLPNGVVH